MSRWGDYLIDLVSLRLRSKDERTDVLPATEEEIEAWRREKAERLQRMEEVLVTPEDRAEYEAWLDEQAAKAPEQEELP